MLYLVTNYELAALYIISVNVTVRKRTITQHTSILHPSTRNMMTHIASDVNLIASTSEIARAPVTPFAC